VKQFVPFHHDPTHSDDDLDRIINEQIEILRPPFRVMAGTEGATFELNHSD